MRALQREYPGLDLLTFHGYSFFLPAGASPDINTRENILTRHSWGLLPAFLDGMLEEGDSSTRFIRVSKDLSIRARLSYCCRDASSYRAPWLRGNSHVSKGNRGA